MVQQLSTVEALCQATAPRREGFVKGSCDDSMAVIDRQLDATYKFQEFIDRRCAQQGKGCVNGQGWFRIVTEPRDARVAIARGQMAVVLALEVDNLFNCKEQNDIFPDVPC